MLHARARDLLDDVRADQAGPRAIGRLASYDGLMLEATGFTRPIGAGARIVSGGNQVSPRRSGRLPRQPHLADGAGRRRRPRQWRPRRARRVERDGRGRPRFARPRRRRARQAARRARPDRRASTNGRSPAARESALPRPRHRAVRHRRARDQRACSPPASASASRIVAGSGVGKSVLMGQMIAGADADVIVVGLIGERSREVTRLPRHQIAAEVRRKSVVVAVPADHAAVAAPARRDARDRDRRGFPRARPEGAAARRQPDPRRPCAARDRPVARRAADGEGLSALGARPDPQAGRARRRRRHDRRLDHRALHRARRRRRQSGSDRRRRPRDRRRPYHPLARACRAGRLSGDRRRPLAVAA